MHSILHEDRQNMVPVEQFQLINLGFATVERISMKFLRYRIPLQNLKPIYIKFYLICILTEVRVVVVVLPASTFTIQETEISLVLTEPLVSKL